MVFEETEADVCSGRSCKFEGIGGNVCSGSVLDSRGDGVEGVGCEVGAAVQHADEREGFREDEVVGMTEEGGEGFFERVFEGCLTGGILHYSSGDCVSGCFDNLRVEGERTCQ